MLQGWLEHGACQFPAINRRGGASRTIIGHCAIESLILLDEFDDLAVAALAQYDNHNIDRDRRPVEEPCHACD